MKIKTGIYNTVAMIYLIMGCDRALTRIVNKKEFVNFWLHIYTIHPFFRYVDTGNPIFMVYKIGDAFHFSKVLHLWLSLVLALPRAEKEEIVWNKVKIAYDFWPTFLY